MEKYQLASRVLTEWESAVRRFAPDEYYRWFDLLDHLPDDIDPQQLRAALAPITAKNDKEQALFAHIFDRILAEVQEADLLEPFPGPLPVKVEKETPDRFWSKHVWWLAPALLLALALGLSVPNILKTASRADLPNTFLFQDTVYAGAGVGACFAPDTAAMLGRVSKAYFYGNYEKDSLETAAGIYYLDKAGCIRLSAAPYPGGDEIEYLLLTEKGAFVVRFRVTILPSDSSKTLDNQSLTYLFSSRPLPHNHDAQLKALRYAAPGLLDNLFFIVFLAMLGVLLGILLVFWVGRFLTRRRSDKMVVHRERSIKPPYVWNINLKDLPPVDPGDDFGLTLNALRRRTGTEIRSIDLPATVRATIRKGGMATLQYKIQTHPPEYLMLIDRGQSQDHQARLYNDLYRSLLSSDILVERFYYEGSLQRCENEQFPEGLTLDELLFRYPNHRLLIVGAGRQFFGGTGQLAKWLDRLTGWKKRALLSPLPSEEWGRRERLLAEVFQFAPANIRGLQLVLGAFEAEEELKQPGLDKLAQFALKQPIVLGDETLEQTIEKYYPDELTRTWLAACAIWPELHYDLTIWLGRWLEQDSGTSMVNLDRFADLLRLPWFIRGAMPDPAREILLQWMRNHRPGLENNIRSALHGLLLENAPPEDSLAWEDFSLRIAFNEWKFTLDPIRKRELEDLMEAWLRDNPDSDMVTLQELTGEAGPLDFVVTDGENRIARKPESNFFGLHEVWNDIFLFLVSCLPMLTILVLANFGEAPSSNCNGVMEQVPMRDTIPVKGPRDTAYTLCIASDAGQWLAWEYRARWAALKGDTAQFGQYLRQMKQLPLPLDSSLLLLTAACQENVATAAYNRGVPDYRIADSLSIAIPGFRLDTSTYKKRACYWFDAAWALDSAAMSRPQEWCEKGRSGAATEGVCRQVAADIGFVTMRNRPMIQVEFDQLAQNGNPALNNSTFVIQVPAGSQVELLDSNALNYNIRYGAKTGYVAKYFKNKPTLIPCQVVAVRPSSFAAPAMVPVKGGAFTMGSPPSEDGRLEDEVPHRVFVSDYSIGRTEVTNAQFFAYLNDIAARLTTTDGKDFQFQGKDYYQLLEGVIRWRQGRFEIQPGYENHPAVQMSWYAATGYCAWLGSKTGRRYRLPTEAEWEYAARGGFKSKGSVYSGSENLDEVAWYGDNSGGETHPVGRKKANELGIFDMSGNVWEWCSDWYGEYGSGDQNNPGGPGSGSYRVYRGGSWNITALDCRVANRSNVAPVFRYGLLGFRLVSPSQGGG